MSRFVTNFLHGLEVDGVPTMGMSGIPITSGRVMFVDYINGGDGNDGTAGSPMKTARPASSRIARSHSSFTALTSCDTNRMVPPPRR